MFHSQGMERVMNRIHERTLRIVFSNQNRLTFKELLEKNKTVSIHHKNLRNLAIEIYQANTKISPENY